MKRKTLLLTLVLFILIAVGMFVYAKLRRAELTEPVALTILPTQVHEFKTL